MKEKEGKDWKRRTFDGTKLASAPYTVMHVALSTVRSIIHHPSNTVSQLTVTTRGLMDDHMLARINFFLGMMMMMMATTFICLPTKRNSSSSVLYCTIGIPNSYTHLQTMSIPSSSFYYNLIVFILYYDVCRTTFYIYCLTRDEELSWFH